MTNPDRVFLGIDFDINDNSPIDFIENGFMHLSSFSAHEVTIDGVVCKTVEHGYHALRIKPGLQRDSILSQRSPLDAWREGQKHKNTEALQVEGYNKLALMEKLCRAKLEQHNDIKDILLVTGARKLLKVFDTDYYWGTGADGSGENQMGKIWMRLRTELQNI